MIALAGSDPTGVSTAEGGRVNRSDIWKPPVVRPAEHANDESHPEDFSGWLSRRRQVRDTPVTIIVLPVKHTYPQEYRVLFTNPKNARKIKGISVIRRQSLLHAPQDVPVCAAIAFPDRLYQHAVVVVVVVSVNLIHRCVKKPLVAPD